MSPAANYLRKKNSSFVIPFNIECELFFLSLSHSSFSFLKKPEIKKQKLEREIVYVCERACVSVNLRYY